MRKKKLIKAGLSVMLIAAIAAMSIFAGASTADTDNQESQDVEAMNMLVSGTVEEVVFDNGIKSIMIENDDMGMIFHIRDGVFVLDRKTGAYLALDDIKAGMTITAVLDKYSPMTASIPPQTSGSIGFIVNTDEGFLDLSVYNEELVNLENTLKLNIADDTMITDIRGIKREFAAEDLKGSECLVMYGASTKSIPAQTTPDFVMILNDKDSVADRENTATQKIKAEYVPLRALAEEKGYTVTWTSHEEPIVLTKNDIRLELMIGSSEFKFEHMTYDLKPLDMVDKLDLQVKLEEGTTMVPNTLIEAL